MALPSRMLPPLIGNTLLLALLAVCLPGCGKKPTERVEKKPAEPLVMTPLPDPIGKSGEPLFERLAGNDTGLAFTHSLDLSHPLKRLYEGAYAVGGLALADVDGDGLTDVYMVSGPGENKLFRQTATWQFEDVTDSAQVAGGDAWGAGAAFADIDGDGDQDLYVCNYDAPNLLYVNDGKGRFTEQAQACQLDIRQASFMPAFCDYDNDGDLDLYIVTHRYYREQGPPSEPTFRSGGRVAVKAEYRQWYDVRVVGSVGQRRWEVYPVGQRDVLLRNDGPNGKDGLPQFTDRSGYAGDICVPPGKGHAAAWWDYNHDGLPDLMVSNDGHDASFLYQNNGDGTFKDVTNESFPNTSWHGAGLALGDLNQDGLIDILNAAVSPGSHETWHATYGGETAPRRENLPIQVRRNTLLLSTKGGRFLEGATMAGLTPSDRTWAVMLGDVDNDSLIDALMTNGAARNFLDTGLRRRLAPNRQVGRTAWSVFENEPPLPQTNVAFGNMGDLKFEKRPEWGFEQSWMSYGAVMNDLDHDGDLDVMVSNLNGEVTLYRNGSVAGARLLVRLQGTQSHPDAIGARVTVRAEDQLFVKTVSPQAGFLASNDRTLHFGLGFAADIDLIEVDWPSGLVQTFEDLPINHAITITEPGDSSPGDQYDDQPLFRPSPSFAGVRHEEPDESTLETPRFLTRLGPGLAFIDLNRDGNDDLYIGGAAGESGQILMRKAKGFRDPVTEPFDEDRACEDLMPLFFDANSDGYYDLYVVSGGAGNDPGEAYQDRLYIGNSRGSFTKTTTVLPKLTDSGGAVAAADFDRDGDLDLFVGGRVIPGKYPATPTSRLLVNGLAHGKEWKFRDQTSSLAPALAHSGMVTSALWTDVDADGWLDLLVSHAWGPIKLFQNQEGQLVEKTDAGLSELHGWWTSLAAGDVDGDGDLDYAAMNAGLNHRWPATKAAPWQISQSGVSFVEEGKRFPVSSVSRPTQEDLATINTLNSGILINDGAGKFTLRPLPRIAQISPGFGAQFLDVDADYHLDLCFAQNISDTPWQRGPWNGGVGQLLLGRGDGSFLPSLPHVSGIIVPGDATALALTDLNTDHAPDIVIARNDRDAIAFERAPSNAKWLTIRLHGDVINVAAVGARIEVEWGGRLRYLTEIYAGGGYLSQTSTRLFFPRSSNSSRGMVKVTWPDGKKSQVTFSNVEPSLIIRRTN